MATVIAEDGCMEITGIVADWDYAASKPDDWPDNPRLASISYHPGGADEFVVRQRRVGAVRRIHWTCADANDDRVKYFHGVRCVPFIDLSECTLNAGHVVIIELWRDS